MGRKSIVSAETKQMDLSRNRTIVNAGYLFILVNFVLGILNILIGLISGSIAITSDAVHSFIDSISGIIIIVSEKLASHHKLTAYRAKIERITTVIIALIIIVVGIHIIVESVEKIILPETPDYSLYVILILVVSIVLKYLLASYLQKTGRKLHSTVLVASGAETMNDTWISVAVLASAILYLLIGVDIASFVSLFIAILIIKVGLEFIFPHLSHHHHHHLESNPEHNHYHKSKTK